MYLAEYTQPNGITIRGVIIRRTLTMAWMRVNGVVRPCSLATGKLYDPKEGMIPCAHRHCKKLFRPSQDRTKSGQRHYCCRECYLKERSWQNTERQQKKRSMKKK